MFKNRDRGKLCGSVSMLSKDDSNLKKLKDQADTWFNRAAMAYQGNRMDLAKQALARRWDYLEKISKLEGTMPPELPPDPEQFFRDWRGGGNYPGPGPKGRDPNQPAGVPRRPLPTVGAGEVALPLANNDADGET